MNSFIFYSLYYSMKMLFNLLLGFLLVTNSSCSNDDSSEEMDPLKKIEKQVIKISKSRNIPSLEITIQTKEKTTNFSYHNDNTTPQSTFGIGSATKLLSAVLIIKKIEEGKLSLDDKVISYIDPSLIEFISDVENISIKNLLNHTSGIFDYTKHPDWGTSVVTNNAPKTFEEKLKYINNPTSKIGIFQYSNSNYLFLQKVLESIEETNFEESFNGFYSQLGLNITLDKTNGLESYYAQDSSSSANVSSWNEQYGFDGGAYTNSKQINSLLQKLFIEKTILTPNSLAILQDWIYMTDSIIPIGTGSLKEYGNGLMKLEYKNDIYIGHIGGTLKYQSFVFFNPEKNITISIITNCSGQHYNNVFFQEIIPSILDEL